MAVRATPVASLNPHRPSAAHTTGGSVGAGCGGPPAVAGGATNDDREANRPMPDHVARAPRLPATAGGATNGEGEANAGPCRAKPRTPRSRHLPATAGGATSG